MARSRRTRSMRNARKKKPNWISAKPNGKGVHSFVHLGFSSYREYLASNLWQDIRRKQLKHFPECCLCGVGAWQVHHFDYSVPVMQGKVPELLVSVCKDCHHGIEFDGDRKRKPSEARTLLLDKLRDIGNHEVAERIRSGITRNADVLRGVRRPPDKKKKERKFSKVPLVKPVSKPVGRGLPRKPKEPPVLVSKLPELTARKPA